MAENLPYHLENIPIDLIDPQDCLFSISLPWLPLDRLTQSIHQNGLLSPLHLQKKTNAKFRIITGFRRDQAIKNLGIKIAPCLIRHGQKPLALFTQALEDNLTKHSLRVMEKARTILKLHRDFEVSHQTLLDEYLPLLDIRPDQFHLRQQLDLASLPLYLQQAIGNLLEPEMALKISRWKTEEQKFYVHLISKFQLGTNKQKKLFILLDEIQATKLQNSANSPENLRSVSVQTIWQQSGAAEKEKEAHLPPQKRFEQAIKKLRQLRFPHLSQHERQYSKLKASLKLPPQIQLNLPPNFEGNQIKISLSAKNWEELLVLTEKLNDITQTSELKKIFNLL